MSQSRKSLYYIQLLRGLAAFLVFGHHTRLWINSPQTDFKLGNFLFDKGYYGVELFFIISGFIMVYTTKYDLSKINRFKEFKTFLIKRIIRIAPLYTLLTIAWFFLFYDDYTVVSLIKIIKSILYIPYGRYPILYLGWSLNYEMFFYLIFALSLLFGKYRYVIIFLIYLGLIYMQQFGFQSNFLKMISNFKINYFFAGMIIALLIEKIKITNKPISLFLFAVSFGLFILFLLKGIHIENGINVLVLFSLLFFFTVNLDYLGLNKFKIKGLFLLGNISYSLYLFHPFLPNILIKYVGLTPTTIEPIYLKIAFYILLFGVIVFISHKIYLLIEIKFTNKLKKYFLSKNDK